MTSNYMESQLINKSNATLVLKRHDDVKQFEMADIDVVCKSACRSVLLTNE